MERIKTYLGSLPVEHLYTYGIAGEHFFQVLKEEKKLLAGKCSKCQTAFLPPKLYCTECFTLIKDWVTLPPYGKLSSYTIIYHDLEEKKLSHPILVGFITYEGIKGGFIHRLGEISEVELKIGLAVEPVFKETRRGELGDILYFKPNK